MWREEAEEWVVRGEEGGWGRVQVERREGGG